MSGRPRHVYSSSPGGSSHPKYWDEVAGQVTDGVQYATNPLKLGSLRGTYYWVYDSGDEVQEEVVYNGGEDSNDCGGLSLRLKPGKKATPANLTGSFQVYLKKGEFKGLRWGKDENNKMMRNYLDIKAAKPIPVHYAEEIESEGHGFGISQLVDDEGNRFINFMLNLGEGAHSSQSVGMLAKKHSNDDDNTRKGLTDGERSRLGIGMSAEEVEEHARHGTEDGQRDEDVGMDDDGEGDKKVTFGSVNKAEEAEDGSLIVTEVIKDIDHEKVVPGEETVTTGGVKRDARIQDEGSALKRRKTRS